MAKYLVTGGCGFIGSHLTELLLEEGHDVRIMDDLSNSSKKNLHAKAEFIYGPIENRSIVSKALNGIDGIFHLAAKVSVLESIEKWHFTHCVNCGGMVNLLEQAKKIPIVYASSAAVYGDVPLPHTESSYLHPLSPYALDKQCNEANASLAWKLYQTPSSGFRFFNVYGSRQRRSSPYSGVISIFLSNIFRNEQLAIYGDGEQVRDFVYVKDVVKILLQGMEQTKKGAHVYNLCSGIGTPINKLIGLLEKITGRAACKEFKPKRQGEVTYSVGDPAKLRNFLPHSVYTPLEEGLIEMLKSLSLEKTLDQLMQENASQTIVQ